MIFATGIVSDARIFKSRLPRIFSGNLTSLNERLAERQIPFEACQ